MGCRQLDTSYPERRYAPHLAERDLRMGALAKDDKDDIAETVFSWSLRHGLAFHRLTVSETVSQIVAFKWDFMFVISASSPNGGEKGSGQPDDVIMSPIEFILRRSILRSRK